MSMYYTKHTLIILVSVISLSLHGQNKFEGLGETSLALNHKFSNNYKANFSVKSRYYIYQEDNLSFKNRQLDIVHFSTLNLNYNQSLSLGIQYRYREPIDGGSNELRLTQQFNHTKNNQSLRFGHRIRFEQRLFNNFTILRSRYRFAIDFPLNGQSLDIGESYLVTSMEALLSQGQKIKPQIDHRTTAQIGWLFSKKMKIQLGLEYRFEAFNQSTKEKLFILSSIILKV